MQLLAAVLLVALATPLSAASHCVDSLPIFGNAQPSTKPPPYVITAAPTTVNAGDLVKVVVSGSERFHSVYLQAHSGGQPLGEFVAPSGQGCRAGVFGCPPGQKNAFSYNSRRGTNGTEVEWKAPQINSKVVFRATIVKSFTEFWVGVESQPITVGNAFSYNSRRGTNGTEVEWKAPQINSKVVFRATIVKSFTEFWVGVESQPITVGTVAV